jgi:hypothetical protein
MSAFVTVGTRHNRIYRIYGSPRYRESDSVTLKKYVAVFRAEVHDDNHIPSKAVKDESSEESM